MKDAVLSLTRPKGKAKLIGADPAWFVRYILAHQSAPGFEFPDENLADYLAFAGESARH